MAFKREVKPSGGCNWRSDSPNERPLVHFFKIILPCILDYKKLVIHNFDLLNITKLWILHLVKCTSLPFMFLFHFDSAELLYKYLENDLLYSALATTRFNIHPFNYNVAKDKQCCKKYEFFSCIKDCFD